MVLLLLVHACMLLLTRAQANIAVLMGKGCLPNVELPALHVACAVLKI